MTKFEAITKSLIWRFFIAIPMGMTIAFFYIDNINTAIEMTIVVNVSATILYYLFDIIWFSKMNKYFKDNDAE